MIARKLFLMSTVALLATTACKSSGELEEIGGISAVRSVCPAVAVAAATGDVTTFTSPTDRSADAIDVVAAITNVRSTCSDGGDPIVTQVSFDVLARRSATDGAREVVLPYFTTVVQGGTVVK